MSTITKNAIAAMQETATPKTQAYDTTATVVRIEGETAWVMVPGGEKETPVSMTIDAKKGDTVQIRIGGGKAWITGNATAPPTDDTEAQIAKLEAIIANQEATNATKKADGAMDTAEEALETAQEVNQYAWHTETDTGAGAGTHITAMPQEDFLSDPDNGGVNAYITNQGYEVRDGLERKAIFGEETIIGDEDGQRFAATSEYQEMVDANGVRAFRVTNGTDSEEVQVIKNATEFRLLSDGQSGTYTLPVAPVSGSTIIVTLTRTSSGKNITKSFELTYETATTTPLVQSYMQVEYDGAMDITATFLGVTGYALEILRGTVEYTQLTTNALVEVPASFTLQNEDFSGFLFGPSLTMDGVEETNTRLTDTDGGYAQFGKWVYVNFRADVTTSMSANNFWRVYDGLPMGFGVLSAIFFDASDTDSFGNPKAKQLGAYITDVSNVEGRIFIATGSTALAVSDEVLISGWYMVS